MACAPGRHANPFDAYLLIQGMKTLEVRMDSIAVMR